MEIYSSSEFKKRIREQIVETKRQIKTYSSYGGSVHKKHVMLLKRQLRGLQVALQSGKY